MFGETLVWCTHLDPVLTVSQQLKRAWLQADCFACSSGTQIFFTYIIKIYTFWIKVSKKQFNLILKIEALVRVPGPSSERLAAAQESMASN